MNRQKFLLLLISVFLLTACEYEPRGNNFIELAPPEDSIPVEVSLNDIYFSDTLYLYKITSITLKINSPTDLLKLNVLIDGKDYALTWNNPLSFNLDPDQLSEGVHKLTVNAIFSSGTGSLAEMLGLEAYIGELSWNILVKHIPEDHFKLGYRLNNEGFLEIFWENAFPDYFIEKYIFRSPGNQITINDSKQKYFVDYGYVCGYSDYSVTIYLKDGFSFSKGLSVNKSVPKVYFENIGSDSLRVCWDKPFANGRFDLKVDNITIVSETYDTTVTIPQIFGKYREVSLLTRPQNAKYDTPINFFYSTGRYAQGISLNLPNWPLYAYNKKDNIIYTSRYDSLVAFDATTLQEINSIAIIGHPLGFIYGGKIATAPHNSTVAAMTGEETWIFTDSRFVNPVIIPSLPGKVHTRLSALTSDDRFFVVQSNSNICNVFNSLTGEKIFEFPFTYTTTYDIPDFVSVSENGKFFCASSENGIEIFEIDGTATKLLYTDTRQYKGAMFVPSMPDKLLIRVDSAIEIRQIPGFNLIQTLDVSANDAVLCNIDPASMNLLYYQNDSLKVCRINNLTETIFKIRSDETTCKMFNNKLLTYGKNGICLDISPYLQN